MTNSSGSVDDNMDEAETAVQKPSVRWPVFVASIVGTLAMAIWCLVAPEQAESALGAVTDWVTDSFGWFYVVLATAILLFVLFLGFSRYGNVRLGPDHSRPEFSTFAWASMLFAAGISTDVMFYSVVEPATQYISPPAIEGETVEAARDATVWALFHYGLIGWGMYALMGLALAYFSYRLGLPLAVRSALRPIFGKRVDGTLGHAVDTAAVLGTIFGVATALGIAVVFLNVGLNVIFGVEVNVAWQIALVSLAVGTAIVSAVSGVDKGIRFLSQLNVVMAIGLALWVLVTGSTTRILNGMVTNVGDFARTFIAKATETFPFLDNAAWMTDWTLFFWAWWVAWASFVGLFLARISRGRTIRQFVIGTLVIPFCYVGGWISIFGTATIDRIRGNDDAFAEAAQDFTGLGFYELLQGLPIPEVVIFIAVFIGILFYVTSADSGALVMANLSSHLPTVQSDGAAWLRITWGAATGLLTAAMLIVGGIAALQSATVIFGLPFAFVLVLVMIGLYKALRVERRRADSGLHSLPLMLSARSVHDDRPTAWKARLARATNFVDDAAAGRYLADVVEPALRSVADEFVANGTAADVKARAAKGDQAQNVTLTAMSDAPDPFVYRVVITDAVVPTYGGRMIHGRDRYSRLEVHLVDGGQGYDVIGYSGSQIINDVLDQFERHLEFLRLAEPE